MHFIKTQVERQLDYSDWKKKNLALGDGGFQILSARYDLFQEYKKSNSCKRF